MLKDNRPTVFVSSTVHDFKDLRSAVRYWLEEGGYRLHFSEFNDFPQMPDKNSYESCLRVIDDSDYFVLFVGSRVGGVVGPDRVSITRMEYRHAYERLKKGQIKIIPFVRKEVWDAREDRKALEAYLRTEADLDPEMFKRIANHPSKLVEDARHVFDFLAEITRNHEMKEAAKGGSVMPIGNWIYQFASFRDIVDALRTLMGVKGHIRRAALIANMKLEIARNLRQLYTESSEEGYKLVTDMSGFARSCLKGVYSEASAYKGKYLCWLGMFMFFPLPTKRTDRYVLDEALASGEFLDFDLQTGRYRAGKLQQALLDIAERLNHLSGLTENKEWPESRENIFGKYKKAGDETYTVPNEALLSVFAVHDRILDLYDLFRAVYKALDGDGALLNALKLRPTSPIATEAAKIEQDLPRLDDIITLLERES